jgi:serine/threonine protein kinase
VFFGRFRGLVFPGKDSSIIGRGGSGVIHVTRDEIMNEVVALKLPNEAILAEPGARTEVLNEARQAKRLTHPNIVRIHDFHEKDGRWGISMQYVHGGNLEEWRGRLARHQAGTLRMYDIAQIKPWVRQLCDALAYAHVQVGIAHCDIKPRNLLLERALDPRGGEVQENILLTDFGISQKLQNCGLHTLRGNFAQTSAAKADTGGGGAVGTLPYMSPQQAAGSPTTMADDIYAIGVTIYELVTGRPPFFQGKASVIQHQIENVVPPPMEQRRRELGLTGAPEIPRQWEEAVARCLAKDPALRPANARVLAEMLGLEERPATTLLRAETIPGLPGWVRSPYERQQEVEILPASLWMEPEATYVCPATDRLFELPALEARAPLLAVPDPAQPGGVTSPYAAERGSFQVPPLEWTPGRPLRCPFTGHPLQLPPRLPEWIPEAELAPEGGGGILNPWSADRQVLQVAVMDWVPGQLLAIGQGRKIRLPASLPDWELEAAVLEGGKLRSPFDPDHWIAVEPADWTPGRKLRCDASGRCFVLPRKLKTAAFEALEPASDGTVRSPYGSQARFQVPAHDWEAGRTVPCPETQRPVRLGADLPLLTGWVDEAHPLQVRSPFDPACWMPVEAGFWTPGAVLTCASTGRAFLMPDKLPLPEAELGPRPGTVISPYDRSRQIEIPPDLWIERSIHSDRGHAFRLKSRLPLLEGKIVERKPFTVLSPFGERPEVAVPAADWKPGAQIQCPATGQAFALPADLSTKPLEAILSFPIRWVISPYDAGAHFEVSPAKWAPGGKILCPKTKLAMLLPANLPPLEGLFVNDQPGLLHSPYTLEAGVKIPLTREQWAQGGTVPCPQTGRPVAIPEGRPEWPQEKKRLPAAWLIGAAAALLLGAGAYLFKDQLAPDPLKKAEETYIATNGSNAEDYLRLLEEAREKAAEDAIRLKHLREQWKVQTKSRASDLTPSLLDEYVKDFEQLSDPEGLRGVEEFALHGSSPDNRTWAERRELDAALAQESGGSPEAQAAKVLALAFAEGRPRNAEAAQWLLRQSPCPAATDAPGQHPARLREKQPAASRRPARQAGGFRRGPGPPGPRPAAGREEGRPPQGPRRLPRRRPEGQVCKSPGVDRKQRHRRTHPGASRPGEEPLQRRTRRDHRARQGLGAQ